MQDMVHMANTSFSTLQLRAEQKFIFGTRWDEGGNYKLRVCSVVDGKVRVLLGDMDHGHEDASVFEIGKGGVWRVRKGERCEVMAIDPDVEGDGKGKGKAIGGRIIASAFVVGIE